MTFSKKIKINDSKIEQNKFLRFWHYRGLNKVYEFNKNERDEKVNKDDEKPTLKKYNKSSLIYTGNHSF